MISSCHSCACFIITDLSVLGLRSKIFRPGDISSSRVWLVSIEQSRLPFLVPNLLAAFIEMLSLLRIRPSQNQL